VKPKKIDLSESVLFQMLSIVPDPRIERKKLHKLMDILLLAIAAVICGCEGWNEIEEFCEENEEYFRLFLELPHGIPSHDTFRRVFCILDPLLFEEAFIEWVKAIHRHKNGDVIAIDGKSLRGSFDGAEKSSAIHLINAWSVNGGIVLGQICSEGKKNEIKSIPKLLDLLQLKGATVTIDAAGCQTEIADKILEKGGDYLLALKKNQPTLHERVEEAFQQLETHPDAISEMKGCSQFETVEKKHGRQIVRQYKCLTKAANKKVMPSLEMGLGFKEMSSMIEATSIRTMNGKTRIEKRYFISSRRTNAEKFGDMIRNHWQVENNLHWSLDVIFNEDGSRIRKMNSAENFGMLRKFVFNLLKKYPSTKSMRMNRKRASWNPNVMLEILTNPAIALI
jgi:predicted transposase YbfD/YdcC